MLFPTLDFALFFLAVFAAAWAARNRPEARKLLLLGASYVFYGYWDWRFCLLLFASSVINYGAGLLIEGAQDPRRRRATLAMAVALNLTLLGFFKYFGFFVLSLNDLLFSLGFTRELPFLEIILPVGISFFTFQGISYVVDVHRGAVPAVRSPVDLLLYISFFPQLVAGPIVRAAHFLPQLAVRPDPDRILAAGGLLLILMGLFKKMVVATWLATEMVDLVFLDPSFHGPVDLLLGIYGYAVQIYCDFSAYSDIAIGVAALLGFRFQRNFDQPYRAGSLREFWRRWHISLSAWLRDYVYIPLGGNRGGRLATLRNLMVTMLLGGIWHGAAWTFVFWGFLHGLGLAAERLLGGWGEAASPVRRALATLAVFHFVCLAWIFFRAESFDVALSYLAGFFQPGVPAGFATPFILALLGIGFAMNFAPAGSFARAAHGFGRLPAWMQGALVGVGIVAIDALGPAGVAPFIYFQF
ncbi:MAG TPA: MBOAT family O-acyltransferase [Alphaproteobacteria bacterium]|nr:MBOAT family O-acyltransferase [Alphaproteobacteria bacterium]